MKTREPSTPGAGEVGRELRAVDADLEPGDAPVTIATGATMRSPT